MSLIRLAMSAIGKELLLRRLVKIDDLLKTHIEDFHTTADDPEPAPTAGLLLEAEDIVWDLIRACS